MLIVKKSENLVTLELPKTTFEEPAALDEIIARLQDAQQFLKEYRQRRLEESVQPLWEDNS